MSSKNKKPVNNNPWCCGEQSTWVDLGKWVQYYYCKKCKKEVKPDRRSGDDDDNVPWGFRDLTMPSMATLSLGPTALQPGEGVMIGMSPCTTQPNYHYWPSFGDYAHGKRACNCGCRIGDQLLSGLGIP